MGQAAAKRAAHPDRIMRDVADDKRQQLPQRTFHHRLVKGGMAHPGTDREGIAIDGEPVEALDLVDVDQMGRPRHPERHDRHQALAARQDTAVKRREFGKLARRPVRPSAGRVG